MVFDERIVTHPNGCTKEEMASQIAFLEQDYVSGEIDEEYFNNASVALNNMWLDDEHWQGDDDDAVFFDPAYEEVAEVVDEKEDELDYVTKSFLELEADLIADKTYEKMQKFYKADEPQVVENVCQQDREKTQANLSSGFKQLAFDNIEVNDKTFDDFGLEK